MEKNLTSRFDGLGNHLLNLQVKNKCLRKKFNVLESKILILESDHKSIKQYGRRNNIEITGTSGSFLDQNLKEKVVNILNEISVDVSPKDIEACHHVGVSKIARRKL